MADVFFLAASKAPVKVSQARTVEENQSAQTVYVFAPAAGVGFQQTEAIADLLEARFFDLPQTGWLILPRPGMISPWSSKVAALAESCGLKTPRLIERATWHRDAQPQCDLMLETVIACTSFPEWLAACFGNSPDEKVAPDADMKTLARSLDLFFDPSEQMRLDKLYQRLRRNPTATELLLIAQTNSEHCRHKIFRAQVQGFDDDPTPLFSSIRSTHAKSPAGTLVAYSDNAAIVELGIGRAFAADQDGYWQHRPDGEPVHTVIKAETHNHPTGISPFPGAATGAGGEIRDEAAAGRGAASHAGFAGYMTGDLRIPDFLEPWEAAAGNFSPRRASPLQIIIDAPLGTAAFGNEFGRPNIAGFFRTLDKRSDGEAFGYCKPVMIAGGMGEIGQSAVSKLPLAAGDLIIQLGGPGLRIGISGGAASSGSASEALDYASVQRDNAQMQRRAQEAIDSCRLAASNPIKALHDVGAGGLGNAVAELASPLGCEVDLRNVPVGQSDMSDAEIWCNEAQERYVAAVDERDLPRLEKICQRASCPLSVLGRIADHGRIRVAAKEGCAVDLPCRDLFGDEEDLPPLIAAAVSPRRDEPARLDCIELEEAARRVLRAPAVADKAFLITIADRSVGGLVARDQLVGPWQTAVADCATTFVDHFSEQGRAMALGERPAVAIDDPGASVRLAIAEALTNLYAADLNDPERIKLSLNWMAACDRPQPAGELVAAVRGACSEFLPELGISVPVGKDSLSMRSCWQDEAGSHDVRAPLTCVVSAFAAVNNAAATLTPQLNPDPDCLLLLLRAGRRSRLGGSILQQVFGFADSSVPDVQAGALKNLLAAIDDLKRQGLIISYHDISDGGLFASAAEMAFAGNCGLNLVLDALCQPEMGMDADGCESSADTTAGGSLDRIIRQLFCEETGVLVQVRRSDAAQVLAACRAAGLDQAWPQTIGWPNRSRRLKVLRNEKAIMDCCLDELRGHWSALGARIRARRDDPYCAAQEQERSFAEDSGLFVKNETMPAERRPSAHRARKKPEAVVLCEQGTNGQMEMAAALFKAGFAVRILFMRELAAQPQLLDRVRMLALPGGFSYGDALGAGVGQAQSILRNPPLREAMRAFFGRASLTLGVCNGCQVLSRLGQLLPDSGRCRLPSFQPNRSRRFEARLCMVEVMPCPSPLLAPLAGAQLPVPVSSGEGRAVFAADSDGQLPAATAALRYVDHRGQPASRHPHNPAGSDGGLCGFATPDGKLTMLMPHPERAVRAGQLSWRPEHWREHTPWQSLFDAAAEHLCA